VKWWRERQRDTEEGREREREREKEKRREKERHRPGERGGERKKKRENKKRDLKINVKYTTKMTLDTDRFSELSKASMRDCSNPSSPLLNLDNSKTEKKRLKEEKNVYEVLGK